MSLRRAEYDFFIAHSGKDTPIAERLFDLLAQDTRVFLDSRCLKYGDKWDVVLPRAQSQSLITVVIISTDTHGAFYEQEEVAAAIQLARREEHRVVPLYINGGPNDLEDVPYGLRTLHYAEVSDRRTIEQVASELRQLAGRPGPVAEHPREPRADVAAVASDGHVFQLPEQVQVSALFRPDESVEYLEVALIPELAQAATGPLIGV